MQVQIVWQVLRGDTYHHPCEVTKAPKRSRTGTCSKREPGTLRYSGIDLFACYVSRALGGQQADVKVPPPPTRKSKCPPQETPWALYKTSKSSDVKIAIDNKCESCFGVWQSAYPFMEWDTLTEEAANAKSEVCASLESVRQKLAAGDGADRGPALSECKRFEMELTRSFVVATESELKAKLKVARISKSQLKGLPCLRLPNDSGTAEEVNYVFKDAEAPLRKLQCKVVLGLSSEQELLAKDSVYWEQQADRHMQSLLSARSQSFALPKLMQSSTMQDVDAWAASKITMKAPTTEDVKVIEASQVVGGDDDELEQDASDCELKIEGVASRPHGLARSSSSTVLGLEKRGAEIATPKGKKSAPSKAAGDSVESKTQSKADGSIAESAGGELPPQSAAASSQLTGDMTSKPTSKPNLTQGLPLLLCLLRKVASSLETDTFVLGGGGGEICPHRTWPTLAVEEDYPVFCLSLSPVFSVCLRSEFCYVILGVQTGRAKWGVHRPPAGDEKIIAEWKARLSPGEVLSGDFDGRTISGLFKKVMRLESEKVHRMAASVLKNYHSLLKLCETLYLTGLLNVEASELSNALAVLAENQVDLPQKMKQDLVQRKSNEMVAAGDFKQLLAVTNPFEEQTAFDPAAPKLSSMPIDIRHKVSTWSEIVFSTLVVDWLLQGSSASKELFLFCQLAMETLSLVSPVDLDRHIARDFGDQKVIFRAIIALLTPSWSTDGQARPWK